MPDETPASRPKPDIRICEIAFNGELGKQIGPTFTSKRAAESFVAKEFPDSEGKQLLIVKVVRRVKLVHARTTVITTSLEDAPPAPV